MIYYDYQIAGVSVLCLMAVSDFCPWPRSHGGYCNSNDRTQLLCGQSCLLPIFGSPLVPEVRHAARLSCTCVGIGGCYQCLPDQSPLPCWEPSRGVEEIRGCVSRPDGSGGRLANWGAVIGQRSDTGHGWLASTASPFPQRRPNLSHNGTF